LVAQLIAIRSPDIGSLDERQRALDKRKPSVLVVAAKWWPASSRLAVALNRHRCNVSALCPVGHPLTHVSSLRHIYRYGGIASLDNLRRAIEDSQPDIVIPTDDGVVAQLHALHESEPSMRTLIERSLGSPASYSVVESRYQLLNMALALGVRVPRTRKVEKDNDIEAWHAEIGSAAVIKVDGESGGNGVRISHSLDESLAAWRELRAPCSSVAAWKRLAVDRDPLALWSRQQRRPKEVTIQEFITGRPANSMLACWRGELLSLVSVVVVAAQGATGAATIVRMIRNERMKRAAESLVSRLKLSGFYGLDFVIEAGTGVPYLIEMNPRCTQLGHIEFAGDGSMAGVLSAVLRGESRPTARNPIRGDRIALFPQALAAGGLCRSHLDASYHDTPSEEPRLMTELMRPSWPRRQWAARLYHAFKPLDLSDPVLFEDLDNDTITISIAR
jgi:carbamoylphosphate synthase large subunit